jgi:hypothetical protein
VVQVLALAFLPLARLKLLYPELPLSLLKQQLHSQLTRLLTASLRLLSQVLVRLVKPRER